MTDPELGQADISEDEGLDLGEVATPPWDGTNLPEWGSKGWVPIGAFGLRHDAREGRLLPIPEGTEEREIAIADMWGQQEMVFEPYVRQLAAKPSATFTGDAIVSVIEQPDGSYRTNGHHRTCAALLRGDTRMTVRVIGRVLPPAAGAHEGRPASGGFVHRRTLP